VLFVIFYSAGVVTRDRSYLKGSPSLRVNKVSLVSSIFSSSPSEPQRLPYLVIFNFRVTRLADFSPLGDCLPWVVFFIPYFLRQQLCFHFDIKMGCATFGAIFHQLIWSPCI
jgi:hypothetical protein